MFSQVAKLRDCERKQLWRNAQVRSNSDAQRRHEVCDVSDACTSLENGRLREKLDGEHFVFFGAGCWSIVKLKDFQSKAEKNKERIWYQQLKEK